MIVLRRSKMNASEPHPKRGRLTSNSVMSYFKQIMAMALLFLFIALLVHVLDRQGFSRLLTTWIAARRQWAFLFFLLSAVVLYSAAFPGNILGAVAYVLFGFRDGVLLMCTAGILSSFLVFLLVRFALNSPFQKWLSRQPTLQPMATALQNRGVLFYCLFRISPFHAAFINALFALTSVDLRKFSLSLCTMLPQWGLYVYFGYAAAQAAASSTGLLSMPNLLRFASIAIFIVVIVYVSRLVQKVLQESTARPDAGGS